MTRVRSPEHREQLKKLAAMANFMDDLPSDKLTMPQWAAADATEHSCGTAGCFAGWTATVHAREGWRFVPSCFGDRPRYPVLPGRFDERGSYEDHPSTVSVADFFGITRAEAHALTGGAACHCLPPQFLALQTPRDVARRIRAVVRYYDPTLLDEPATVEPPAPYPPVGEYDADFEGARAVTVKFVGRGNPAKP